MFETQNLSEMNRLLAMPRLGMTGFTSRFIKMTKKIENRFNKQIQNRMQNFKAKKI